MDPRNKQTFSFLPWRRNLVFVIGVLAATACPQTPICNTGHLNTICILWILGMQITRRIRYKRTLLAKQNILLQNATDSKFDSDHWLRLSKMKAFNCAVFLKSLLWGLPEDCFSFCRAAVQRVDSVRASLFTERDGCAPGRRTLCWSNSLHSWLFLSRKIASGTSSKSAPSSRGNNRRFSRSIFFFLFRVSLNANVFLFLSVDKSDHSYDLGTKKTCFCEHYLRAEHSCYRGSQVSQWKMELAR